MTKSKVAFKRTQTTGESMSHELAQLSRNERVAIHSHEVTARKIQEFLWEGRPKRSKKKEHTVEEYQKFLVQLSEDLWKKHNEALENVGKG